MNHILHFFTHFKINHVNIIDLGCRVFPPNSVVGRNGGLHRAESDKERSDYKSLLAGRKTNRKLRKNRKTKRRLVRKTKRVIRNLN